MNDRVTAHASSSGTIPKRTHKKQQAPTNVDPKKWIRGVNLGGWLVLERYITPYQFAITSCHIQGDLCWYEGQLSAPPTDHPDYKLCPAINAIPKTNNTETTIEREPCEPILSTSVFDELDYPIDEWTLAQAFTDRSIGEKWLNFHFDNFISRSDLVALRNAGLSHLRVPLPHWILQQRQDPRSASSNHTDWDVDEDVWIAGDRWKYFVRMCGWARELGLEVWPDIHTAPGSQNGFDNSGVQKVEHSCQPWSSNPAHVERSLRSIRDVVRGVVEEGLSDVVTGFGLLNEPFLDCDFDVYKKFMEDGLDIVRDGLGKETAVFVHDQFSASKYNDGSWWLPQQGSNLESEGLQHQRYQNTYLDSHYYQVFAEQFRALSPRQHIAFTCQGETHNDGAASCCYSDPPHNRQPSLSQGKGVQRLVSEWSCATDTLVVDMLRLVMKAIRRNGTAAFSDRIISPERMAFLNNFAQAQMVVYETANVGVSGGWFYWTAKMEGGAFAEWDFLRGIREGWIPKLPSKQNSSQAVFGTCQEIIFRTDDDMDIIHEYPPREEDPPAWQLDDDVVISHGESLLENGPWHAIARIHFHWIAVVIVACSALVALRLCIKRGKRHSYEKIDSNGFSLQKTREEL